MTVHARLGALFKWDYEAVVERPQMSFGYKAFAQPAVLDNIRKVTEAISKNKSWKFVQLNLYQDDGLEDVHYICFHWPLLGVKQYQVLHFHVLWKIIY